MGVPARYNCGFDDCEPVVDKDGQPTVVTAKVYRVFDHSAYLSLEESDDVDGAKSAGLIAFSPARMFINGRQNVMSAFPDQTLLRKFLVKDMTVRATILPIKPNDEAMNTSLYFAEISDGSDYVRASNAGTSRKYFPFYAQSKNMVTKTVTHVARVIWSASDDDDDVPEPANNVLDDEAFYDALAHLELNLLSEKDDEVKFPKWKWTHVTPAHFTEEPTLKATEKGVAGIVQEILEPHGGVVKSEDGKFTSFFSRSVVTHQNKPVCFTQKLGDLIKVGTAAIIDLAACQVKYPGKMFDSIATSVKIEFDSESPQQRVGRIPSSRVCHKVRVLEFEQDEEQKVVGGKCMILPPYHVKTVVHDDALIGEVCEFKSANIFLNRLSLVDMDFGTAVKIGDEMFVTLEKTPKGHYRVDCGIHQYNKADDRSSRYGVETPGFHHQAVLARTLPAVWESVACGRAKSLSSLLPDEKYVYGHVIMAEWPPKAEGAFSTWATMQVACGPRMGEYIDFSREGLSVFGIDLSAADLNFVIAPGEPVIVDTSTFKEENGRKLATRSFLGDKLVDIITGECKPENVAKENRMLLHRWLVLKYWTFDKFVSIIKGELPALQYSTFTQDIIKAVVVRIDCEKRSGVVRVEEGFYVDYKDAASFKLGSNIMKMLENELIYFKNDKFMLFNRNMAKADMAYVLTEMQKVNLEVSPVNEAARASEEIPPYVSYMADILWVGSTRPRSDVRNKDAGGVPEWLKKKGGMTVEGFDKLAEGKMDDIQASEKSENGFYFFPVPMEPNMFITYKEQQQRDKALLRSQEQNDSGGTEIPSLLDSNVEMPHPIINMLEAAANSKGPDDPVLGKIIVSDEMAQAAHQISQALTCALDMYKEKQPGQAPAPMWPDNSSRRNPYPEPEQGFPNYEAQSRQSQRVHQNDSFRNGQSQRGQNALLLSSRNDPFQRRQSEPFQRSQNNSFQRGQNSSFQRGQNGSFQRGQNDPYQRGQNDPYQRRQSDSFQHGQNSQFQYGQNNQFQYGQNGQFQYGQSGQFQYGQNSQLQHGQNSQLQHGQNGQYQYGQNGQYQYGQNGQFQRSQNDPYHRRQNDPFQHSQNDPFQHGQNTQFQGNTWAAGQKRSQTYGHDNSNMKQARRSNQGNNFY